MKQWMILIALTSFAGCVAEDDDVEFDAVQQAATVNTTTNVNTVTGSGTKQLHGTAVIGSITDMSVTQDLSLAAGGVAGTRVGSSASVRLGSGKWQTLQFCLQVAQCVPGSAKCFPWEAKLQYNDIAGANDPVTGFDVASCSP